MKPLPLAALLPLAACMTDAPAPSGMANPASVYCTEQSGRVEIRREAAGDVGYCYLPDGRIVEEWAFFRAQGR